MNKCHSSLCSDVIRSTAKLGFFPRRQWLRLPLHCLRFDSPQSINPPTITIKCHCKANTDTVSPHNKYISALFKAVCSLACLSAEHLWQINQPHSQHQAHLPLPQPGWFLYLQHRRRGGRNLVIKTLSTRRPLYSDNIICAQPCPDTTAIAQP